MSSRTVLLERLAHRICELENRSVIAIDGVDGAGKTMFSDELALVIQRQGRSVLRASVDGFHNSRTIRYRRGAKDPVGFFQDSYDYDRVRKLLLEPFRGGASIVKTACFDHTVDRVVVDEQHVEQTALLLFDGIFLHRDELRSEWDFSIFLDVPFSVSYARMAARDGSNPDPLAPENRRYNEGQNIYLQACDPRTRATVAIDNSSIEYPKIMCP